MTASRILAMIACFLLVASFALATLMPPDLPLGQALLGLDRASLASLHALVVHHASLGLWQAIGVPILQRPSWMLPAMLGIVFGGLSLSFRPRAAVPTRRRRS